MSETQSERNDEPTQQQLAQWWLDYGITRKITKRNCMTFPYGSKQRGFSDQILEDTLNPHVKAHGDIEFNPMKLSAMLASAAENEPVAQSTQDETPDYQKSPEDCPFDADDKPSDIYQLVADKSVIRLKEIVRQNCSVSKNDGADDEPTQQQLAQWWLDWHHKENHKA